jgi:hypothetical protein
LHRWCTKSGLSGDDESFKYGKIPIGVSPLPGPRQLVTPEAWAADNKARKVIATERGAVPDALNFKTLSSTILTAIEKNPPSVRSFFKGMKIQE